MSDSTKEDVITAEEATTQEHENQYNNNPGTSGSTIESVSNTNLQLQAIQNDIQLTLNDLSEKLAENAASIKRVEESIPALYDRIDKTMSSKLPKTPKKKNKKGKKSKLAKKLGNTDKKDKKLRTKNKSKSKDKDK